MGKKSRLKAQKRADQPPEPIDRWKAVRVSRLDAWDTDRVDELRRLSADVDAARELLREAVVEARRVGFSWGLIGDCIGVSAQAARQRYGT